MSFSALSRFRSKIWSQICLYSWKMLKVKRHQQFPPKNIPNKNVLKVIDVISRPFLHPFSALMPEISTSSHPCHRATSFGQLLFKRCPAIQEFNAELRISHCVVPSLRHGRPGSQTLTGSSTPAATTTPWSRCSSTVRREPHPSQKLPATNGPGLKVQLQHFRYLTILTHPQSPYLRWMPMTIFRDLLYNISKVL